MLVRFVPILDRLMVFENSGTEPILVAEVENGQIEVFDESLLRPLITRVTQALSQDAD